MSSQTQPQNVHVACLTTVRLISTLACFVFGSARTGRYDKRSAQHSSAVAAPNAARLVAPAGNHFPGRSVLAFGAKLHRGRFGVRGAFIGVGCLHNGTLP